MFSLQTRLKLYIIFSLMVYIVLAVSVSLLDIRFSPIIQSLGEDPAVVTTFNNIYIFILIMTIMALIYGITVLVFTYIRGVNKYHDIARRLSSIEDKEGYNLTSLEFPMEDEFGSMGRSLNGIVTRLERFDDLKVQRIKIEQQKFELLADKMTVPVLVIDTDRRGKRVKYYNKKFQDVFAKRKGDDSGSLFYDLKNAFLNALNIQNVQEKTETAEEESEKMQRFLDEEFIHAIELAVTSRTSTTIKKDIVTIGGDEIYHSDSIDITPIWNDHGDTLDVVIIFEKLRKK